MSDDAVLTIWKRCKAWSAAADALKRTVVQARVSALVLNSLGAVLATVAATCFAERADVRTACAGLGAACLAAATYVTAQILTVEALRSWTRARSVSEAIKGEIYMFRAGAAPYQGADALSRLQAKTSDIQNQARDLERHVAPQAPKPSDPPPALSQDGYIAQRAQQQIDTYYRPKARTYARWLSFFRSSQFVLGLGGTILGAWAAVLSNQQPGQATSNVGLAAWVAVFTTLGAAVAAHIAANRYDFLVMSYYGTARRLEDLVGAWQLRTFKNDPDAWSTFVKNCEEAISIENEGWMAKWTEEKKP